MADAPSFQFYPKDWRTNGNLQRCSLAARGAWMEVMCLLHDADEYGVLRWPLEDIAQAAHVPADLLRELASKGVLKGSDACSEDYTHRPFHAGKHGEPVALVSADGGACWYSSRFVKDAWRRSKQGASTRFSEDNPPPKNAPSQSPTHAVGEDLGERHGDGAASAFASASSSTKLKAEKRVKTASAVSLPAVLELYHAILPSCQAVAVVTDKRKRAFASAEKIARQICAANGWAYGLDFWRDFFTECSRDPWTRGEKPNPNNPSWKQNLGTLISEDHFAKIMDRALENLS